MVVGHGSRCRSDGGSRGLRGGIFYCKHQARRNWRLGGTVRLQSHLQQHSPFARPHLLILPPPHHQLETKCLDTKVGVVG